jgi:hypothetical protein
MGERVWKKKAANVGILRYYKKIVKGLPQHALSNFEIDDICANIEGFQGTYPADKCPDMFLNGRAGSGSCILNTATIADTRGDVIAHWVAIWKEKGRVYCYDSFGRPADSMSPYFQHNWIGSDPDVDQLPFEMNCGARSISFILCAHRYGISEAIDNI